MKKKLSPAQMGVLAALAPIVLVLLAALAMNVSASATAPVSDLAGTEYCYTSADGDWLICKLKED